MTTARTRRHAATRFPSVLALLIGVPLLAGAAGNAPSSETDRNPDSLWAGGSRGAVQFSAADGALLRRLPELGRIHALAVDPRRGHAWISSGTHLSRVASDGTVESTVPLFRSYRGREARTDGRRDDGWRHGLNRDRKHGKRHGRDHDQERARAHGYGHDKGHRLRLLANPADGGVWVLTRHRARRYDAQGERQVDIDLSRPVLAATLDTTRDRLWLATPDRITGYDTAGSPVARLDAVHAPRVRDLAYEADGDVLWLATLHGLRRVAAADGTSELRLRARAIGRIAADGAGGVWATGGHRLRRFDAAGNRRLDLRRPLHRGGLTDLAANPADQSLWLAGRSELVHVRVGGAVDYRQRLPGRMVPGRIAALGLFADLVAPELAIEQPTDGALLNDARPPIDLAYDDLGGGVDPTSLALETNGQPLAVDCDTATDSATCVPVSALQQGTNAVTATVTDHAGNASEPAAVTVRVDTVPPTIRFTGELVPDFLTNDPDATLAAEFDEPATVTLDGSVIATEAQRIEQAVTLAEGGNSFELGATDRAGNSAKRSLTGTLDTQAPPIPASDGLAVAIDGDTATVTGAAGSVEADAAVVIINERTGEQVTVIADADGAFSANLAAEPGDTFTITARDAAGNVSDPTELASGPGAPPDPIDIAPPLPATGTPPLVEQVSFLYEGAEPIQQGVAPGTIEPERVSVLRGEVRDRQGQPIPNVEITILDHPELGHTRTQADGGFDLAVNGGGRIVVEYNKDGYLPVQRSVSTEWNGWYHAEDVVMIDLDDNVTSIDLTDDSEPFQVARGSVVEDSAGSRQATLLFPAGTTAEITLPDGTQQVLDQLDVRATEYTVGASGPAAMPGELPPQTAYTYAIELSVDQALEQGVKVAGEDVTFNQPVPFYVDNFLEFPTGEPVPVGYYDNDAANWVPHENGRIVEVLDVENGSAILDVTGDGEPASESELAEIGLTEDERTSLAGLYEPGDTLWRFTTTHLSTWDCNWSYGPPEDASQPTTALPETGDENEPENSDEEDDCDGCVISPQKQSLGESIDVVGTPYALHYQSNRSAAVTDNEVQIPVTGDDLPDSLRAVRLEIEIAGQSHRVEFDARTDQNYRFEWNGRDRFGRAVNGSARARIRLSYLYPCRYLGATGGDRAFARFGAQSNPIGTRDRCKAFEFPRMMEVELDSPLSRSGTVGNWDLSVDHDLGRSSLQRGDGRARDLGANVIETSAGTGDSDSSGDRESAVEASLYFPQGLASGPDGSLYIAEAGGDRVRRIAPDGTITTVAGTGTDGFDGDGGPATDANLNNPVGLDVGPDGVYVVDYHNSRIRRIGSDGLIDTVAGSGSYGPTRDGISATKARLESPWDVAIGPDGAIYIAEGGANRVRRVAPDGIIDTVAGTGDAGFSGDGGPAVQADLESPASLAFAPDGDLYIGTGSRVRRIDSDGTIRTIAGTGEYGFSGDGGPATDATLTYPSGIDVAPDGTVYISDQYNQRIRKVSPDGTIDTVAGNGEWGFGGDGGLAIKATLDQGLDVAIGPSGDVHITGWGNRVRRIEPGEVQSTPDGNRVLVSAEDPSRRFTFDDGGRILRVTNTYTGERIMSFSRDSDGRLTQVLDGNGNTTTIERDDAGRAHAILAPDGQRTDLALNEHGHLAAATDPAGSAWAMEYTGEGLLTRIDKPGEATNTFAYDGNGRLIKDVDPNGGGWQLARTPLEDGYRTDMTSGEGRVHRFTTERPNDRERLYTNEAPDGTVTRRVHSDTGATIERPDGTTITTSEEPDPRFGMGAPYVAERDIELPTGLTLEQTTNRTAELTDPGDPLSLDTLVEKTTTNGRTHTAAYDGAAREWSISSPEGRTVTTAIDGQSRPLARSIPGLAPIATTYDDRGRPVSVEQGDNANTRTTTFAYHDSGDQAGYLASITDALDRTIAFDTDAAGRVTEQTLPDGRSIGYQYDARGNLTALTPPGRDAHVFEYDGLDQRTDYTPPDLDGTETITRYRYNLDRQLTEIQRPGDETITFDHDAGGRVSARRMPIGETSYAYSADTGQLASIQAPGGIGLRFEHNGFLPAETAWTGPVSGTVSRGFDNNFWLIEETVNGQPVPFDYDDDGLLIESGTLAIARDAGNGLVTGTTQQGVAGSRAHNPFGELAGRTVEVDGDATYDVEYTRDKLGRIVEETETIAGESTTWAYDYDLAGRLTEVRADGTPVHLYGYDANGNRTSHTGPAGTRTGNYDGQDRLTAYGNATYTHTPAGERATKTTPEGTTSYDYDAAGNLREVVQPDSTTIEYLIDGRDRRVGKKVDGELTEGWLYRDQLNPVARLGPDGSVTHRFVYGDKANVPAYMIHDGTTYRIVSDHLGSVRLVIDTGTGEIVQRMDYGPFGEVTTDTNPGFQPFGFAGGLYDADTGLVRFGARDYDPEIGRWTAKDPIGFSGGDTNLYGYVVNDPINLTDAHGLAPTGQSQGRTGVMQSLFPAHTAQFSRNPIGGSPESQMHYADTVNGLREFNASMAWIALKGGPNTPIFVATPMKFVSKNGASVIPDSDYDRFGMDGTGSSAMCGDADGSPPSFHHTWVRNPYGPGLVSYQ